MSTEQAQKFIPIKEIRDGVVVLKDGTMCAVLLVTAINFSLKSYDEQQAIIFQFQNFLNSLEFDSQIVVQSRRLDIRPYLKTLEEQLEKQEEELLRVQTREYIQFIRMFNDRVQVMDKKFYVVVPYGNMLFTGSKSSSGLFSNLLGGSKTKIQEQKSFEEQRSQLEQRVSVITQGLGALGVRSSQLKTEEAIELFYLSFNPGELHSSIFNDENV